MKDKLDDIDRKILSILQENGKITNAQLSKEVGLSPAPTLERVKKLENAGYIQSYHARVDPSKLGLGVSTFVQVGLAGHSMDVIDIFIAAIDSIDEIVECHHITGTGDFILKIITRDIPSYQKLMLEKVSNIEVVDTLESMIILSTFKDSKKLPFPEES